MEYNAFFVVVGLVTLVVLIMAFFEAMSDFSIRFTFVAKEVEIGLKKKSKKKPNNNG